MNYKLITLFPAILLGINIVAAQEKPFSIKGSISGKSEGVIYLSYQKGAQRKGVEDSAIIRNGKFLFKGALDGVTSGHIIMDKNAGRSAIKYVPVLLSPGNLKFEVEYENFSTGVLSGTKVQDEMNMLNTQKAPVMVQYSVLSAEYEKANTAYMLAMREQKEQALLVNTLKDSAEAAKGRMQPVVSQLGRLERDFMRNYPSSYVTASLLRNAVSSMPLKESEASYAKFSPELKNSSLGKAVLEEIKRIQMGSPGSTASAFTSTELRGGQLSLSDYRGRYVLIDFWASWCVPCRKGNPHLLALHEKYKDKGFEIIGVSDDDGNHEAWKKAVEQDKIGVWKHVLRGLKRTADGDFDRSNSISDRYSINSLPTKVLVDPNGVIIGRYGGGGENDEAMDKKLAEIFKG